MQAAAVALQPRVRIGAKMDEKRRTQRVVHFSSTKVRNPRCEGAGTLAVIHVVDNFLLFVKVSVGHGHV